MGLVTETDSSRTVSFGIVEFKNVSAKLDLTICQIFDTKKNYFCLRRNSMKVELKTTHEYYYQVQGLLCISDRSWCDFVVQTKVDILIQDCHCYDKYRSI